MTKPRNEHLDIIYRWLKYSKHVDLAATLHNMSFHNIAIYGGGVLGELLFDQLYSTDIAIKCVIDQNPDLNFPYDVDVVTPDKFSDEGVDAVIVAPFMYYGSIKNALKVNCPVVSLDHLIIDVDVLQDVLATVKHVEEAGAKLLVVQIPHLGQVKNLSLLEQRHLADSGRGWRSVFLDSKGEVRPEYLNLLLSYYADLPYCSEEYVKSVYRSFNIIKKDNIAFLQDITSKYFNVVNGVRYTVGNPKVYDSTIHFFGNCMAAGVFTEDKLTIESQLQELINVMPLHNKTYRVVNRASWQQIMAVWPRIINTELKEGDIAVLITRTVDKYLQHQINSEVVYFYDLVDVFDRPHDMGEIFFDASHPNYKGYKLIVDRVYSILSEPLCKITLENRMPPALFNDFTPHRSYKSSKLEPALNEYLSFLKKEKVDCSSTIGAIVMNCNPFTLGHKYLIEEARQQCDFIYIFVVEEDKSFFSFADRLMLVKANTAEMNNVKVLPSGSFIISTLTFPEYFIKSENVKIDASKDIKIFAESIAPTLSITKRFVGEEPFDPVTNQYNQAMIAELPRNGIAVVEIPRKQSGGVPISASLVRKLLDKGDFDEIAKIVPDITLEYLKGIP